MWPDPGDEEELVLAGVDPVLLLLWVAAALLGEAARVIPGRQGCRELLEVKPGGKGFSVKQHSTDTFLMCRQGGIQIAPCKPTLLGNKMRRINPTWPQGSQYEESVSLPRDAGGEE